MRKDGAEGWKTTLTLAVLISLASIVQTFCVNQYFHILFRMSLHMKVCPFLRASVAIGSSLLPHPQQQTNKTLNP
jgi:hypothetical protein